MYFASGCSNISFFSIPDHFCIVLSSIPCLFSIDYEVGLCPLEFMLEMPFFSLLPLHLRPTRCLKFTSQDPQYCLKKTSRIPHEPLENHPERDRVRLLSTLPRLIVIPLWQPFEVKCCFYGIRPTSLHPLRFRVVGGGGRLDVQSDCQNTGGDK
jgi:hypothetical protein